MIGVSMPNFWQGLLNIVVFCVYLGWLPSSGFSTPAHWILPAVTIGTSGAAAIMRTTRSTDAGNHPSGLYPHGARKGRK